METIQYSLKNTYSINIAKIISTQNENTNIEKKLDKNCFNLQDSLNIENTNLINNNKNNIFDNHCIKLYGKKTCILFYEDNYNIEVRLLDKITNISFNKIKETSLYKDIPNLLENKYTVVIVKTIDSSSDTKEITDIHLPPT
jgi:hypothetical protein